MDNPLIEEIYREQNGVVILLTKQGVQGNLGNLNIFLYEVPPMSIQDKIDIDKAGIGTIRNIPSCTCNLYRCVGPDPNT